MSEGFYITNKGIELINQAVTAGTKVDIKKAQFGSGGNIASDRDYDIEALKHKEYEKNFDPLTDSYEVSETDEKTIKIKVVVPTEVSATINEIGFLDEQNNLIIYGNVRERVKEATDKFQYECYVKFDNLDDSKVEIVIVSPEYEKVEKLVEDTKADFDAKIKKIETEFNIENYPTNEDLEAINTQLSTLKENIGQVDISELKTKVETMESEHQQILETLNTWV